MAHFLPKVRGNERPQRNIVLCVLIYDAITHTHTTEFYVLQDISVAFSSENTNVSFADNKHRTMDDINTYAKTYVRHLERIWNL